MREDCLDALAELAPLRARRARRTGHDAAAAVDAYLEARAAQSAAARARSPASLTVEGTGDLPALMLAVRALRALAA